MPRTACLVLGLGIGALIAGPLATTLTTLYCEWIYLPRIAGED